MKIHKRQEDRGTVRIDDELPNPSAIDAAHQIGILLNEGYGEGKISVLISRYPDHQVQISAICDAREKSTAVTVTGEEDELTPVYRLIEINRDKIELETV